MGYILLILENQKWKLKSLVISLEIAFLKHKSHDLISKETETRDEFTSFPREVEFYNLVASCLPPWFRFCCKSCSIETIAPTS